MQTAQGQRIQTYREFWPFYVSQHLNPTCRALHFAGTSLVLGALVAGAVVDPRFIWLAPVGGYGFAWIGHFVFEKNRPATFSYPLWSLIADFHMYAMILSGRMPRELSQSIKR